MQMHLDISPEQEQRRAASDRRSGEDRRQVCASMISNYITYSGPERRSSTGRRQLSDRRR